jgi:hypothetical protein
VFIRGFVYLNRPRTIYRSYRAGKWTLMDVNIITLVPTQPLILL